MFPVTPVEGSEKNYPVHDKELLAMKYALVKFRVHLLGQKPFVIYTDHASLRTATSSPHLSLRMARWLSFFAEYRPLICHITWVGVVHTREHSFSLKRTLANSGPITRGVTKLAHQWLGPARIDADAGFDNWRVTRLDTQDGLDVHCSFLLSYHYPPRQHETVADRILRELALEEDEVDDNGNGNDDGDGAERPLDGEDDGTRIERHNTDGARTGGRAASGSIGSPGDREPGTAPPEQTIRSQPEIANTVVGSGPTLGQQAISRSEDAEEKSTAILQTASRHLGLNNE
ncbi:unnamed protein product [Phytophthora fragariaefolia]|uniref:Unnamed protein product n=1 Tax=Phytophthora fragariaefolia TaxID=1490495 RepID=A0A9W7CS47_9STRA|nr:unnamed protein product [Phytophthora fragariaefolia]